MDLSSNKKTKFSSFCYIFGLQEYWTTNLLFSTSFRKLGWKSELCSEVLLKISRKKWKVTENCHSESVNQRCSALNQRCYRDFQVMNSAELELKFFWIRDDHRWMSLKRQPGVKYPCVTCPWGQMSWVEMSVVRNRGDTTHQNISTFIVSE